MYEGPEFSASLPTLFTADFFILAILMLDMMKGEVVSHCGFIFYFPDELLIF